MSTSPEHRALTFYAMILKIITSRSKKWQLVIRSSVEAEHVSWTS